ncbi:MAG: TonB-dependent receptor [Tannerellaceae bacterium]|jgi:TonB-linked SusC/RagA family outer membrane protein|nr:TonB-dependent receptor [Tannerellaceae bacterium]
MNKSNFKQMMGKGLTIAVFFLITTAVALAQTSTVAGTVTDEAGEPLIGVNVSVKGTTNGAITDINGKYQLQQVGMRGALVFSYVGFITQEVNVAGQRTINVKLKDDTKAIEEVVVVGYGTQAKKDITGSVAVVSTEDLQEIPVATFAEALQGRASGVYVSSSGAPGAPTTIRIRGVGSINGSDPLVVVDGVSNVPIDAVNPNDIESLQVLKDASATAIYGAQGANGVIIITTKQGQKNGKIRIQYDGFTGIAKMANDGYDVLNGWEAMEFEAMGMINMRDIRKLTPAAHAQFGSLKPDGTLTMPYAIKPSGLSKDQVIAQFGSIDAWINSYRPNASNSWARSAYYQMLEDGYSEEEARRGTDWYGEVVQTGKIQDHQLSVLGGNDKGMYSMAVGYSSREGTFSGSAFERYSMRINATYNPTKYLTVGQNTNLAGMQFSGDRGIQGESTIYAKTYTIQSWVPVYNVGGDFAGSQAPLGGRDVTSVSLAYAQKYDSNRMFRGQTALFAEVKPYKGLTLRTQYSVRLNGMWNVNFSPITIMTNKEGSSNNSLEEQAQWFLDWQWTNTATYATKFKDDHSITVVVGSEALNDNDGRRITATRINYTFEDDPNTHIINNGATNNSSNTGYMNSHTTMFGLFGRADYSFQGKYLASISVRRDASSKFGALNRWGTFPSASVGWRVSDESFMASTRKWLDDLKFRAGYGTTGNSNIGAYNYAFQYATGDAYLYSITGSDSQVAGGYHVSNLGDANAKWETVRSMNVGFDATAMNNRLTASIEWYIRKTTDMLVPANWSALAGNATRPQINIGDMENKGFDASIGWRDRKGAFRYSVNANISTYRNKVLKLGSSDLFVSTRLNNVSITTVDQPVGMFYGYKVLGIYKSESDVTGYKDANGSTVIPFAAPSSNFNPTDYVGRYKLEDVNGDGKITAADRTIIGNPHPDFTGGFNINLGYKNFDLATYLYYSVGNDLYKHYMFYTHYGALQSNYSKDRMENSWHPTNNPNGVYPLWATSAQEGAEAGNESNSMYVDDGSYLRMQTFTLGYSLPKNILKYVGLERIRIYGQISNVFTLTKYPGLDPEVRTVDPNDSGRSFDRNKGVDFGSYGMPRQFIVGINLSF